MSSEDNIARLHQSIKAINHGDVEGFLALYASTCIFHDCPGGGTNTFEQARQNAVESLLDSPQEKQYNLVELSKLMGLGELFRHVVGSQLVADYP